MTAVHDSVCTLDSALSTLALTVEDGLAVLTINRPEARNAIDEAMTNELLETAVGLRQRTDLRALLIRAAGPAFTVGGDLELFKRTDPAALPGLLHSMAGKYHQALTILAKLDIPVVAAVHGAVAGGGLGLMNVADIVIAADDCKFAVAFGRLGLSGDGGASWFLPRFIGLRRTAQLYLQDEPFSAAEALEWGLLTTVVPPERLEITATETARRLASGPTVGFGEIRRLLRRSADEGLETQFDLERDALARTSGTADGYAAIRSFVEKTEPLFEGR
jgi:2-(1,2-epoxy-1,2-dihydrophenyl)acetyl-CoA isomerase